MTAFVAKDFVLQCDAPSGKFLQVASGCAHVCAITEAGYEICFGDNSEGQRDIPLPAFLTVAVLGYLDPSLFCVISLNASLRCYCGGGACQKALSSSLQATSLSSGASHMCALLTSGSLACWLELPNFGSPIDTGATRPPLDVSFVAVSCGSKWNSSLLRMPQLHRRQRHS